MKKILIICLSILLLTGCGNVKLENGKKEVVTFKEANGISSNNLYKILKEKYGINELLTLIDTELLNKEFKESAEEINHINESLKTLKSDAGDKFLEQIKYYYNINSEKEFKEFIRLNYRRSLWIEKYAKEHVTDKEIKDFYDNVYVGDMELSHILITSKATDEMNADEKTKKEEEALNKAKDIIKKLNEGSKFKDLAKEFSEDEANKNEGGKLGIVNYGMNFDRDFVDAAAKIKEGKYSKEPVKTQFGYHIILKTKQEKKKELKKVVDTIRNIIADEYLKNNKTIYITAFEDLRKKYKMEIKDKKLKKDYEEYTNKLRTQ